MNHFQVCGDYGQANEADYEHEVSKDADARKAKELGIKWTVNKQRKYVEEHYDDCGEDFGPLGEESYLEEVTAEDDFCAVSMNQIHI